jgi:hypothetical protein
MKVLESTFMLNLIHDLTSLNKFKCISHITVMDTSKINRGIAVFFVFLTLVVIYEFTQIPIIDIIKQSQESQVAGFLIQFEDGTAEPEVKTILEDYSMILNYSIDCNAGNGGYKYYIKVYKDNLPDIVGDGLKKDENWTDPALPYFKKGDYIIYPVTEQAIQDKNFLAILKKSDLQVKRFVWCDISYENNSTRYYILGKSCIPGRDAIRIKNELEKNEKVWTVMPEYICY